MFEYRAYGLGLSSNRPLPWFQETRLEKRPDLRVRIGELPPGIHPARVMARKPWYICPDLGPQGCPWVKIWSDPETGYFFFCWSDDTKFAIDPRGRELWGVWPPALKEEDVIPVYMSGNLMSFILRLRGYVCLHASAVVVERRALLIGGQHGSGKSTLAAAFARLGYAVLSDDVSALKWHRDDVMVYPSFPRVSLWPRSVKGLFGPDRDLPRLWPNEEKRFLSLGNGRYRFPTEPLPLGAVYALADWLPAGEPPRIEPAVGAQALIALVANTFGVLRPENDARAAEFRLKVRVAERPVRRVHRAPEFSQIDALCDAILRDFRSLHESRSRPAMAIPFGTASGSAVR